MAKKEEKEKKLTASEEAHENELKEQQAKTDVANKKVSDEAERRLKATEEDNARLEANSDKHLEEYYEAHPDKRPKKK